MCPIHENMLLTSSYAKLYGLVEYYCNVQSISCYQRDYEMHSWTENIVKYAEWCLEVENIDGIICRWWMTSDRENL